MGTNFELNMNDFLPLRDVVFNTLRQAILRGELQPGERLLEIHLANKLGVSRTPIREAMRKLELEGLDYGKESARRLGSKKSVGRIGCKACLRKDSGRRNRGIKSSGERI